MSLEVDDGVQLREGRVGAGVGLSLQIPHRHLAVVVPRQQVPAAPVPTSMPSQHTGIQALTHCRCGSPIAGTGCSCTHINIVSTQTLQLLTPCHWGSPTAGTGCSCTHINMVSTHTTITDPLLLWFPDSRYWLLLCPHQRQVSTQTYSHLHLAVVVPQ